MVPRSLPERVATVEMAVDGLAAEGVRTRDRLHKIETNQATVELLARSVHELRDDMPKLAQEAAERAVLKLLEHRDELRRKGLSLKAQYATLVIAVVSVLVAVVLAVQSLAP